MAELFEGRTRLVERLARTDDPLADAPDVFARVPEDEVLEALNAHPRIGAPGGSPRAAREQGDEVDPVVLRELDRLNRAYEDAFGLRFVVFVDGRPRSEILRVLEARIGRTREDELRTAVHELVQIARDRYRRASRGGAVTGGSPL